MAGSDGKTPYVRRHGEPAPYTQFPLGALVLVHPHRQTAQRGSEPVHDKLQSRLSPAIIVEITIGPAGRWAPCYGVVPLSSCTAANRAAKA